MLKALGFTAFSASKGDKIVGPYGFDGIVFPIIVVTCFPGTPLANMG